MVLSGDQFPVLETLSYTPTGRAKVATASGTLEVLIADSGLTRVLDRDLRAPGAFTMAAQQLLAETALITLERPNAARAVLMTPPRRWDPPTLAAKRLLDAFAAAPWLTTAGLDSFSRTRVPSELVEHPRSSIGRPPRSARSGSRYSRDVLAVAEDADAVRSVLVGGGTLVDQHESAVLRAASVVWTADPSGARAYLRAVRQWVRGDRDKVRVIGRSLVTLSGSRGTIPITVSNGLPQAVRVRPTISPLVPGRLRARSPELLTIAAGRKATVRIPAEAGANGITRVVVELRDAAGNPYGPPTYLRVNVTNYGSVGLIVVLGGGGLLFAVAIVRNIRRVQRARHRARAPERFGPRGARDHRPIRRRGASAAVKWRSGRATAADKGERKAGDPAPPRTGEDDESVDDIVNRVLADVEEQAEKAELAAAMDGSLTRSSAWMAVGTIASRITGFARDLVLVWAIGTAVFADAYNVANTVPNIVYILVAGGVLNAVFVPQLVRAMRKDADGGKAYADRLHHRDRARAADADHACAVIAAPLVISAYAWTFRQSRLRGELRRRGHLRPVLPAADLLLRPARDARSGPQRPRQVRADDVHPDPEQPRRDRHRRRCSCAGDRDQDPLTEHGHRRRDPAAGDRHHRSASSSRRWRWCRCCAAPATRYRPRFDLRGTGPRPGLPAARSGPCCSSW